MPDALSTPARLRVVTSDQLGSLLERLAADLAGAPLEPLVDEVIVVQSQGMRRWIQQELARRQGCSASLRLPFPARFARELVDLVVPDDRAEPVGPFDLGDDPFDRDVMTWRVLDLLEGGLAAREPFSPIRRFCAGSARQRLGLAARIAGTFDDYFLYRPELLAAWDNGELLVPGAVHEAWQAELWRMIRSGSATEHAAERLRRLVAELDKPATAPRPGLPERLAVFGVSSLPPVFISVLRALSRHIPVTFYLGASPSRSGHPLADAWGGQSRALLDLLDHAETEWMTCPSHRPREATVLTGLQRALTTGEDVRLEHDEADRSLTLHLCHSPLREMEVLRDQLLEAFDRDASLRPHDVLVMVPDIGTYGPCIETVFGAEAGGPALPHQVADRPLAREFSLARHTLDLLALVDGRRTAVEVLALLEAPAIRARAGLAEGDLNLLKAWAEAVRIRWGTDGAERQAFFGLPEVEANTWRAGLDRLLMGHVAGPLEELMAGILPSGGDTAGDSALLGRFVGWAARLFAALDALREPRTLSEWRFSLLALIDDTVLPDGEAEERAMALIRSRLETLAGMQFRAPHERPVSLDVVRDWLEHVLSDDSLGTGFLTGGITFAAFKPMRAIPFKVIAMAGLEDASFPRRDRPAAFDLIAAAPRPGDRSLRTDDRQLFLDSLLAAQGQVILSYTARSAVTNARRAASVVIAELLDHLDRKHGQGLASSIIVEHRLQPFSPEYFLGTGRLFSYSAANAAGVAASAIRVESEPFAGDRFEADGTDPLVVSLADLIDCWVNPSRFWCKRILRMQVDGAAAPPAELEPFSVDALVGYGVKLDMVRRRLGGRMTGEVERELLAARGDLPPGALTAPWHRRFVGEVESFLETVGDVRLLDPIALDVRGGSWTLTGRIDGVVEGGCLQFRPAKLKIKDRVRGWITHVALAAQCPGRAVTTRVVAEDHSIEWRGPADPIAVLDRLVAGYRAGLTSPLPVFEAASWEFARPRSGRGKSPLEAAIASFEVSEHRGSDRLVGDATDPHVALCWRGRDPFADDAVEFQHWSRMLWDDACAHEVKK